LVARPWARCLIHPLAVALIAFGCLFNAAMQAGGTYVYESSNPDGFYAMERQFIPLSNGLARLLGEKTRQIVVSSPSGDFEFEGQHFVRIGDIPVTMRVYVTEPESLAILARVIAGPALGSQPLEIRITNNGVPVNAKERIALDSGLNIIQIDLKDP